MPNICHVSDVPAWFLIRRSVHDFMLQTVHIHRSEAMRNFIGSFSHVAAACGRNVIHSLWYDVSEMRLRVYALAHVCAFEVCFEAERSRHGCCFLFL
jgi:hypothetical protein